jgi:hypothetical protein
VTDPSPRLVREWAAYALAASVSRFVPVPLLDDVVKERAVKLAVTRTLRAHGRGFDADDVEVLWSGADGVLAQARKYAVGVPSRIALFPVRKYVAVMGSVKGVPSDVMAVILLARTVHRRLDAGDLADDADPKHRRQEARRLRKAYDAALDEMDLRLFTGALRDGLSTGRNLGSAAVAFARRLRDRDAAATGGPDGGGPGADVDAGAARVQEVLARPEISRLMAEFDRRVDEALERR